MRRVAALAVVEVNPDTPTALTSLARDVLREAAAQARAGDGMLFVLGIVAPLGRELFWSDLETRRILRVYRSRLRQARELLRQQVYEVCPGVPAILRVQSGPVADLVSRHARESRARLVVVGDRPQNPVARWLAGRSLTEIVREAPCPVLIVNGREEATAPEWQAA
jgi:nucleotide-binding universal stress UspA family protein